METHVVLALSVAVLDHHTTPDALEQRWGVGVAKVVALLLLLTRGSVAQAVVAVRKRALSVVRAVVFACLALLDCRAHNNADREVGRGWRRFVALGLAVSKGVALAWRREHALAGRGVADVALLAGLRAVHAVTMPVVERLVLAARANRAVLVHRWGG